MKTFTVQWIIEVSADSAKEAALTAQGMQRDSGSLANVFTVFEHGCEDPAGPPGGVVIDLDDDWEGDGAARREGGDD